MASSFSGSILVLDNYDSFTYNLVHCLASVTGRAPTVLRNDAVDPAAAERCSHWVLSPGPGLPEEAGDLVPLIRRYAPSKNMLGICLGMQAIGVAFGARLRNLDGVLHGVARDVTVGHPADALFHDLPKRFPAGRYHSWVVDRATLPAELRVTAADDAGEVMALRHARYGVCGVQFHPESVMTPHGRRLLENWLASGPVPA
jgi:anthranilate synthase component 2